MMAIEMWFCEFLILDSYIEQQQKCVLNYLVNVACEFVSGGGGVFRLWNIL